MSRNEKGLIMNILDQIHNFLGEVKRKEGGEYANSASRGLF